MSSGLTVTVPRLPLTMPQTQQDWTSFINQIQNLNAGYPQTDAERAAGIMPANTAYFGQPWVWVRREGCAQDGTTDDSANFNKCLTIAASTNTAILIDGPCYLNSNIVIPQNVQLVFVGAGMLKPASGKTITLGQTPQAGLWQIFDYSSGGTVLMPPLLRASEVWAEWWGANGDGVTNLANEVAINAAMVSIYDAAVGSGGKVRLGMGEFFISNVINVLNTCSLEGINQYTLIKANGAINWVTNGSGQNMVNVAKGTGSMFDCNISYIRFDANAPTITGVGNIINSVAMQNRCGVFNCVFANYVGTAFNYTQGYGGAALLEFANCDFFPNDFNGATGIAMINVGTVGWMKVLVRNCAFASGGSQATIGIQLDNRIICDLQNVDFEQINVGVLLKGASTVTGSGVSPGGNAGISAVFHCGSTWTAPGYIDVSGVQIGAAAAMITDANRVFAYLALEPMDGRVVHPSSMSQPVGTIKVTGGAAPTVASGQALGVCAGGSVSHIATGQMRITLGTSMDSSIDIVGIGNSQSALATQVQVVPVDATHVDIYTYTSAGTATDSSSLFVQLFHTP